MRKYRRLLLIATVLLIIFGLLMIYSSSYIWAEYKFNDAFKYLKQQALFAAVDMNPKSWTLYYSY